jgi:hypothetical protein
MIKKLETVLKDYAQKVKTTDQTYQTKTQYAKQNYRGELLQEQLRNIKAELDNTVSSHRETAYKAVNETITRLYTKVDSMATDSNPEALYELNALNGLKISQGELQAFVSKYKTDYLAMRKLADLADTSGLHLNYVSIDDMKSAVDYLNTTSKKFIRDYDGSKETYGYDVVTIIVMEHPFEDYEQVFNGSGSIDITIKPKLELTPEQKATVESLFKGHEKDAEKRAEELNALNLDGKGLLSTYYEALASGE